MPMGYFGKTQEEKAIEDMDKASRASQGAAEKQYEQRVQQPSQAPANPTTKTFSDGTTRKWNDAEQRWEVIKGGK